MLKLREILEIPLIPVILLGYAILLALYAPIALAWDLASKAREKLEEVVR